MMLYEYLTFIVFFIVLLGIVSLSTPSFPTAFSAVAATFNNIGPGIHLVGPTGSYAFFRSIKDRSEHRYDHGTS